MNWPAMVIIAAMVCVAAIVVGVNFSDAAQQRATTVPGYLVVTACGTLPTGVTYTAGTYQAGTMDVTGKRC